MIVSRVQGIYKLLYNFVLETSVDVAPELQQRIIDQVEWYFSDDNLLKDSFLVKHIRRNKQGLVSLKLVASFRKVKAITKDWRAVQSSLLHSAKLELNDERNKVRRIAPLPEVDYSHILRTVIVQNYPEPQPLTKDVEREFTKYGEVSLVRILHPGMPVPVDVKPSRKLYPGIGKSLCLLVEFESQGEAKQACRRFHHQQSWRDQLSVSLLSKKEEVDEMGKVKDTKEGQIHFLSPGQKKAQFPAKTTNRKRGKGSPAGNRHFLSPDNKEKEYLSDSGCSVRRARSPRLSPEPIRKFPSDQALSQSRRHPSSHAHDSRLIRQPWGPDGSRGFVRNISRVALPVVSILC